MNDREKITAVRQGFIVLVKDRQGRGAHIRDKRGLSVGAFDKTRESMRWRPVFYVTFGALQQDLALLSADL